MKALVVFNKECNHWAAGFLDRQLRHVFCVLEDDRVEDGWIEVNLTRSDGLVVRAVGGSLFDLMVWYGETGEVVPIDAQPARRHLLPLTFNNCVGYTKALLGIRSRAITPAQLYRHLTKEPEMHGLRLDLTLPGLRPRMPAAPEAPPAPPPPPTQVDARRQLGLRDSRGGRQTAENIRNRGGNAGTPTMQSSSNPSMLARALKSLTGQ